MDNEIMDVYRKMLGGNLPFDDNQTYHPASYNDDDVESFITSEELSKMEDQKEVGGRGNTNTDIEEVVGHFKRYSKRRVHKYTEKEMEEIRNGCVATIVHDYAEHDEYHMSDEERHEHDSLKEISAKLGGLKRTYRKVNQYIRAMRIVVEAWEILEKKENFLHDEDEFFEMVAEGKIYHNRIIMPKLVGMKNYDIDMIIKYISNPELDPDELMPKPTVDYAEDDWYRSDEEDADEMERLLSPSEVQYILDHSDNPETIYVEPAKTKYIRGYDQRGVIKSNRRKLKKSDRFKAEALHTLLNKIQSNPSNRNGTDMYASRFHILTHSMFEPEEKHDDFWDDLRYDGSWTDKNGLKLYDIMFNECLMGQMMPRSGGMTYGDDSLTQFFKTMEQAGMNVMKLRQAMNMRSEDISESEIERSRKENKKIEAQLLQRITKLNRSEKFKKMIAKSEKKLNNMQDEE